MSLDASPTPVERHVRTMRRLWRWYLAALAAVLAVVGVVIGVVWAGSDYANAHLHAAAAAAPAVGVEPTSPHPTLAWQDDDTAAIGEPFIDGTVVTYSAHTVTGRNARTGAAVWSYTRSNSAVCRVAQLQAKTVALYGSHCDQVSTFDSGTGKRAWVRTLDENAMTIHGRPRVLAATDTLFVWTGEVIYAVDPTGGLDRWTLKPTSGCTFTGMVPGQAGVLISEHCASSDQLLLRDRYAGYDDKASTEDKKQQIDWRVKAPGVVPVAADAFVAGYDPATHRLVRYDTRSGKVIGQTALTPPPGSAGPVGTAALQGGQVVWIGGRLYVLTGSGAVQLWQRAVAALPTVTATAPGVTSPSVDHGVALVPTGASIEELSTGSGRVAASYPVAAPPTSRVYRLGAGFLVAADGATQVYQ